MKMKLTTLFLLVAAVIGVSLASPYPRLYHHRYMTEHVEPESALYQQQQPPPTPQEIEQICAMAGIGKTPFDVFDEQCRPGGPRYYSFCRLSPQQISDIVCPRELMMSAYASAAAFARHQQINPALVNHLKNVAVFCSMAEGSSDAQIIRDMLKQLCSSSPPTEDIVALVPNYRQQVEQTADFCNLNPATDPGQFLLAVLDKCNTWSLLINTICSSQRELCKAILGAAAVQ